MDEPKSIEERLEQIEANQRRHDDLLDVRLKLLSGAIGLGVAIVMGAIAGSSWEYKSEHGTYKFGLSDEAFGKIITILTISGATGAASAIAVNAKAK